MTLAATRRYAFGASLLLGLAATLLATGLISVLLGDPEEVVMAMSGTDLGALLHLILDRFAAAARVLLPLL